MNQDSDLQTDALEALVARTAETIAPSVVRIGRDHRGSGVIVEPGVVVTNAHNLRDRTTTVSFVDGTTVDASVRAIDADGDLVALEADTGDRPAVTWTADDTPIGRRILAVGIDPGAGPRATLGRVSATARTFRGPRGRRIDGALEHTAPVRRGGSGGPIVDVGGHVVGLSTHRPRGGLYLALPVDDRFRRRLASLLSGTDVSRPRLGLTLAPSEVAARLRRSVGLPARDGILVRSVETDGPAAAAGIGEGDLIVRAGDSAVTSADDLFTALDTAETSLVLGIVRGADDLDVTVTLGSP